MDKLKLTSEKIRQFFWPSEAQKRASIKKTYKTLAYFTFTTGVLIKFGRQIADLIYNQNQLEEMIRAGIN